MKRFAIIMAGGSGTRFWPKSTRANPKQFLSLAGANSLIQQTSLRIKNLVPPKNQFVVTTESLRKLTRKHLPKATLLCEPEGRNTLAAIAWSAWTVEETSPGATMIVLPSDAFIQNENAYREVIGQSCEIAESLNMIVCVGIKPNYPATGYGYIQAGENLRSGVSRIMRFVEKPGPEKAEQFINEGTYCWNAGIFIAKSSTIIDEVRRVQPAVAAIMDQIIKKPRMLKSLYKKVPKLPFDIAIMERTHKGAVVFGDFGWNDLGSWPALLEVFGTNHPAGHTSTEKNLLSVDSSGNIISRSSQKLLALVGVQDLIFVETENAILISKIQEAQKIKTVVEELSRTAKTRNKFT